MKINRKKATFKFCKLDENYTFVYRVSVNSYACTNKTHMLSIFTKKKISDQTLANVFVNGVLRLSKEGFSDIADLLNNDLELISNPRVDQNEYLNFSLIVFTGNIALIPDQFNALEQMRFLDLVYAKFAQAIGLSKHELKQQKNKISSLFKTLNHPSKNTQYAMSKALFHMYDLYGYQEDYFKNLKVANPVALKKINDIIPHFLWDWDATFKRYKPVFK